MSKLNVHIAVPNENWIAKHLVVWIGQISANKEYAEKWDLKFNFRTDRPIDNNRNKIVKEFLEDDGDFLFFIDSDNPPYKDPMPLIDLDLDIVACPTPIWDGDRVAKGGFPILFNCCDYIQKRDGWMEHDPKTGLQEIDAAGTGCMIIARRVLEKVRPAFVRRWNDDGIATHGSDFEFTRRAKEAGFRVWASYDHPCHHLKEMDVLTIARSLAARDVTRLPRKNPNTEAYWNEQWEDRGPRHYPFYDEIANRTNGGRVLDYGCGRGDLLALLGSEAIGADISWKAVDVCSSRGLKAVHIAPGSIPDDWFDLIIATEVLEHVDDDIGLLNKFFRHTNKVIYTVPNNCLPPGLEREHRRVYTMDDVVENTPHYKRVEVYGNYLMVTAEKEANDGE